MRTFLILIFGIFVLACIYSCGNSRQFQYLQGAFDTATISKLNNHEPSVQKGDLLGIVVYSDNPQATAIYNQPNTAGSMTLGTNNTASTAGYLVDSEGNIQFQGLGNMNVEGLTRKALNDTLLARLKVYLTNPYVSIRFLNYKITVIGDVNRPGIYNIPGERVNVLEAIGLAGEITIYGRKDNVLVIREVNGKREFGRLDLRRPDVFGSAYYYLQQNDIVLIDQSKNKQSATDQTVVRNISIASTIISTVAIVYSIIRR